MIGGLKKPSEDAANWWNRQLDNVARHIGGYGAAGDTSEDTAGIFSPRFSLVSENIGRWTSHSQIRESWFVATVIKIAPMIKTKTLVCSAHFRPASSVTETISVQPRGQFLQEGRATASPK